MSPLRRRSSVPRAATLPNRRHRNVTDETGPPPELADWSDWRGPANVLEREALRADRGVRPSSDRAQRERDRLLAHGSATMYVPLLDERCLRS
jgi:hypothetical protein